jgi:hypothetical protein
LLCTNKKFETTESNIKIINLIDWLLERNTF